MDWLTGILSEMLSVTFGTVKDVLPIVAIIFGFQFAVIKKKPANLGQIIAGFVWVLVGLSLFLLGLEWALFPFGRLMAEQLTNPEFVHGLEAGQQVLNQVNWKDYYWVYIFV